MKNIEKFQNKILLRCEISCADYLVKIPSNEKFSSLNLSHSAIIFCFELFKIFSNKKDIFNSSYKSSLAKKSEVNKFLTLKFFIARATDPIFSPI